MRSNNNGTIDSIFEYENIKCFLPKLISNVIDFLNDVSYKRSKPYVSSFDMKKNLLQDYLKDQDNSTYIVVTYWNDLQKSLGINIERLSLSDIQSMLEKRIAMSPDDIEYFDVAVFNKEGRQMSLKRKITLSLE